MVHPFRHALRHAWLHVLLACVALATWLAYAPGLQGTFVFDDFGNLPALGAGGPVHDLASALRYVTSGKADPTGRPLATLSFLLDATNWPASPYSFKRTNLIIHLMNGALLTWFLVRLGAAMGFPSDRARVAAVLTAALWLLNPLLTSTVLYVVQREAMLPATFLLLAGLCWLHARERFTARPAIATAWLVFGTGSCTLLALLCKANGAAIPLLILVCEWALPKAPAPRFRSRLAMILGPWAALLLAWLAWLALSSIGAGVLPFRGWSVWQRIITEPTILWRYLAQLWLVVPTDASVLHDGMAAASGLFDPWYTLPAILGCVTLLVVAVRCRSRWPALALAMVFFFAGHLMEASSIPLELYFDHRNYLPALLIFWPLALAVTRIRRPAVALLAGLTLVGVSALLTRQNASLWGDAYRQAIVWARANPGSPRSQAYAAQVAMAYGKHAVASDIVKTAMLRLPNDLQTALTNLDVQCGNGEIRDQDLAYARGALAGTRADPGSLLLNWFEGAITTAYAGRCAGFTPAAVEQLLATAMANPSFQRVAGRRQDLEHVQGQLALAGGHADEAAQWFQRALLSLPSPTTALSQAAALGAAGRPDLGVAHLDAYSQLPPPAMPAWRDGMPRIHAWLLQRQGYWAAEVDHLRQELEAGILPSFHGPKPRYSTP